jgi:hypothetical protein
MAATLDITAGFVADGSSFPVEGCSASAFSAVAFGEAVSRPWDASSPSGTFIDSATAETDVGRGTPAGRDSASAVSAVLPGEASPAARSAIAMDGVESGELSFDTTTDEIDGGIGMLAGQGSACVAWTPLSMEASPA